MVDVSIEKKRIIEMQRGSFEAFEYLYNTYSGKLYNFIMRLSSGNQYLAEEVVQATFIRIWEVRDLVNPEASFISFICTIAKNKLMNVYERETVAYIYKEHLVREGLNLDWDTQENIDLKFLHEYIDALAEKLPEQRRKIFLLSKRKEYTNKEIAQSLNISESTVSTQLSLALKYIRSQMLNNYDSVLGLLLLASLCGELGV